MATLAEVQESIKQQTPLLETTANGIRAIEQFVTEYMRQEGDREELRREELRAASRVSTTPTQIPNVSGAGGILAGLPIGGLGAIAAIAAIGAGIMNADTIKSNVETLLSIGDRYSGNTEEILTRLGQDGAVVIGLGVLGKSLAAFAVGGAFNAAVDYFSTDWAGNVVSNVEKLLSIGDKIDLTTLAGFGDAAKAALLPAYLGILGKGLVAFAVGSGATALADGIHEFIGIGAGNWAENVKKNVESLLSINIGSGVIESLISILKPGALALIMGQLSAGLIAFSVGSAATGIADAVHNFIGFGENWGEKVKNNIEALLSIGNLNTATLANVTGVMSTLAVIGAGLAVFGGGAAIAGVGQGVAEAQQSFSIEEMKKGIDFLSNGGGDAPANWAEGVVANIKTLLSIGDLTTVGNLADFTGSMAAIAAGLAVFGGGAAAAGIGVAVAEVVAGIRFFTGGTGKDEPPVGWIPQLKKDIDDLLSINFGNAAAFNTGMGNMGAGMVKFFGSQGLAALTGLVTDVIGVIRGFFTGDENTRTPVDDLIDSINKIGGVEDENIRKVTDFSNAITGLAESFTQLGSIRAEGISVNLEKMLRGIGAILDAKQNLLYGGEWDGQRLGFGDNIEFGPKGTGGLANFSDEEATLMREGVSRLYSGLGLSAPSASIGVPVQAISDQLENLYVETLTVRQGLSTPIINVFDQSTTGGTNITNSTSGARPQRPIARNPFEFYNRR